MRLAFLVALSLGACAVEDPEQGEVGLPGEGGKADEVFGRTLYYEVRDELVWQGDSLPHSLELSVVSQTDRALTVASPRIAYRLRPQERWSFDVDSEPVTLADLTVADAFLFFWANDTRGPWNLVHCGGDYFFRHVYLETTSEYVKYLATRAEGPEIVDASYALCGIPANAGAVALFPFPTSGWGRLVGRHGVTILASRGS